MRLLKTISWNRFVALLRLDWAQRRSHYLGLLRVLFLVPCAILCVPSYYDTLSASQEILSPEEMYEGRNFVIWTLYFIFCFYSLSDIFPHLHRKTSRVAFFSLPATTAEKYVSRFFVAVIFQPLLAVLCIFLADVANATIWAIVDGHFQLQLLYDWLLFLWNAMNPLNPSNIPSELLPSVWFGFECMIVSCFLALAGSFLLGGTFFRRRAFLLTVAMLSIVNVVVSMFSTFFFVTILSEINTQWIKSVDVTLMLWLCNGVTLLNVAWVVLCCVLSYRLFVRSEVVSTRRLSF